MVPMFLPGAPAPLLIPSPAPEVEFELYPDFLFTGLWQLLPEQTQNPIWASNHQAQNFCSHCEKGHCSVGPNDGEGKAGAKGKAGMKIN